MKSCTMVYIIGVKEISFLLISFALCEGKSELYNFYQK
jgi:hypothetical protein